MSNKKAEAKIIYDFFRYSSFQRNEPSSLPVTLGKLTLQLIKLIGSVLNVKNV